MSSKSVIVCCRSLQAKVMDRDGMEKMECPKGWPYIANMANTNVSPAADWWTWPLLILVTQLECNVYTYSDVPRIWLFQSLIVDSTHKFTSFSCKLGLRGGPKRWFFLSSGGYFCLEVVSTTITNWCGHIPVHMRGWEIAGIETMYWLSLLLFLSH